MKLTLPQQDVYFEQLLYPDEPIYNIGAKILIEGKINPTVFNQAYKYLIKQHDTYRTIFKNNSGSIAPLVVEQFEGELACIDFSEKEDADENANDFMQKEFIKPFDITSGQFLHKFILIKISSQKHYLFSVYHHIITDGWGTSLMFQRLVQNYNELIEHDCITSKYLYSYKDFIVDDKVYLESKSYLNDKEYWLNRFKVLPENLFEKKDSHNQKNKSKRKAIYIKRKQYNSISNLCKTYKVNTFHFILGVLFLYFGRKHKNEDFAIGFPVLNRGKSNFKKTVGLFMGVSPLRLKMDFDSSLDKLLTKIRTQLRQDYRHQRFPLGKLVQEINSFQEKERLFNITLSYEKQNYADHFHNTKTTVIPLSHQSERVALAIYIREFDEEEDVKIDFDYNINYFNEFQISQVTSHFQFLLDDILENPDKKLYEFNYLSKEEKHQLQYVFNNTNVVHPKKITFLDVFKEKVEQYPNRLAVHDENSSLLYKQLDELSDTIAQNILTFENELSIGVLLNRSVYTIATLLGILKAGKSYIPLDPTFPKNRLKYIINHSELKTIISDQNENSSFKGSHIVPLEEILDKNFVEQNKVQVPPKVKSEDTAYIIYTSGSTGNPKGVKVGHGALLNFLLSIREKPSVTLEDTLFAVTTYSFDISILEFFVPLISGANVYIASNEVLEDYSKTIDTIQKVSPSIIQATPSFYQLLINGGWEANKQLKILCGGDLLSEDLAYKLTKNSSELWNMYGPTETTIWSSVKQIAFKEEASNIGSPIANTQYYVLDEYLQLLPIGSYGILYVGGQGLAKGYFKDEKLTSEKFINNPYGEGLLYNTNDLVKWNKKGELVFLGRNDNQVKIRGFRIELGDIEEKINQIPQVIKGVVVAKKQQQQETFLVAYIQKNDLDYNVQDSIGTLEKELPKYMVPYVVREISAFPLTPNNKIDRKRLAAQEVNGVNKSIELPKTQFQKELAQFWQTILGYNKEISLNDNFFALGGHSLNAVKLTHQINKKYGFNSSLKTIFDHPTIASLSSVLEASPVEGSIEIPIVNNKEFYHVTPSQYQLWVASQKPEQLIAYNMVAAFEVEGSIHIDRIEHSILKLMVENEILRTNFIEKKGQVYQKIKSVQDLDFSVLVIQKNKDEASEDIKRYINKPFNLEDDLLLRIMVIQTSKNTSILVFCTHHIIVDGISLEFFTKQLKESYQTKSLDATNQNKIQFKDYAEWLYSNSEEKEYSSFYKEYLKSYQVKESIYRDDIISNSNNSAVENHYSVQFNVEQTNLIKKLAKQNKSTPYNIIIAFINTIIYTISGHEDIVIGTVNSGRNLESIASLIGMFVKTLPLRVKLNGETSFFELIQQVKEQSIVLDQYQDMPMSIMKNDLFDILITYQNPDFSYQQDIRLDEAKLKYLSMDTSYIRIPLLFNFFEADKLLNLTISYDTEKYEELTMTLIVDLFKKLLEQVVEKSSIKLQTLKDAVLEGTEDEKIEFNFNF